MDHSGLKNLRDVILKCSVISAGGEETIAFRSKQHPSAMFCCVNGLVVDEIECDWVINSNDFADVSSDGLTWYRRMYCYINSDILEVSNYSKKPYMTSDGECYQYIKPVLDSKEQDDCFEKLEAVEAVMQVAIKEVALLRKKMGISEHQKEQVK